MVSNSSMASVTWFRFKVGVAFSSSVFVAMAVQWVRPGVASTFLVRPDRVGRKFAVRYSLTGSFGGYRSSVSDADRDGAYRIPLFVDPKTERAGSKVLPAKKLKAILYAPGCQFSLLSFDLVSTSVRRADFRCEVLPTITLKGRVVPVPRSNDVLGIRLVYLAFWGYGFFGYVDGIVQTFVVGSATVGSGGRFVIDVPDFRQRGFDRDAYLRVFVIKSNSGEVVEEIVPPTGLMRRHVGMKISQYPSEVTFSPS